MPAPSSSPRMNPSNPPTPRRMRAQPRSLTGCLPRISRGRVAPTMVARSREGGSAPPVEAHAPTLPA